MLGSIRSSLLAGRVAVIQRNFNCTDAATTVGKVYELRTYNIWPQYVKPFLSLTSEQLHLRTAQSKLVGYWTPELGGLNQVVHLWEYDSLEHRAQVRANLAGDKEWIERYFSKILPMMSSQENSVLSVIPDVTFSHSHDEGVYQLQTLQCHNSRVLPLTLMESGANDFLVTAFKTIIGERDQIILLWKHSSLSAAINFSTQQQSRDEFDLIRNSSSKILLPHAVSPLH